MFWVLVLGFLVLALFSETGRRDGKQVPHRAYRPIRNDINILLSAFGSSLV